MPWTSERTSPRQAPRVNFGRFLEDRRSTPIWWRRARFSSSRAARERKIEDRVARSVVREMSIGENYKRNITPIRSHISRFSRGTGQQEHGEPFMAAAQYQAAPEPHF